MLTTTDQLAVLRGALRLLDLGAVEQAHLNLMEAIPQTPTGSPCYPAMIGTANWIHPLNQPKLALRQLAAALLKLDSPFRYTIATRKPWLVH